MTVTVRDRGAARLLRTLGAAQAAEALEVGVLGDLADASSEEGLTVGQVAEWMEFGTPTIPPRSWLRAYVDENEAEINRRVGIEMRAVIAGARSRRQALERVGVWIVGQIQERIARGIDPANAPSTIARKGSSTPLIDTGQLRSSIASRIVEV